ncbi:hypothetical protein KEM54_006293 [Ascosphaera aggregata]|nr:hypothetical protein KEM54_006293 [Ascosphaera aggregata]
MSDARSPQHRRLTLGPEKDQTITFGRASSKDDTKVREPSRDNALFRSCVVSKQHARIGRWDHQLMNDIYIEDLGSLHGTYVNNELLLPNTKVPLNHHDILQLGMSFRDKKGWIDSVRIRVEFDRQITVVNSASAQCEFEELYEKALKKIQVPTPKSVETSDFDDSGSSDGSEAGFSCTGTSPVNFNTCGFNEFSKLSMELDKEGNAGEDDLATFFSEISKNVYTMPGSDDEPPDLTTTVYTEPSEDPETKFVKELPVLIELADSLHYFVALNPSKEDDVKAITTDALKAMIKVIDTEGETSANSKTDKPPDLSLFRAIAQLRGEQIGHQLARIRKAKTAGMKRKRDDRYQNLNILDDIYGTIETRLSPLFETMRSIDPLDSKSIDELGGYSESLNRLHDGIDLRHSNSSRDEAELVPPGFPDSTSRKAMKTSGTTFPGQSTQLSTPGNVNTDQTWSNSTARTVGALAGIAAAATALFAGGFFLGGMTMLATLAGMSE